MAPLALDEARAAATAFVCGQTYFGDAHVQVVLTARFDRAFWKYRNHRKALTALLMDAAHLSQTLYLVATELGLGAFVTAAINNTDIEERFGLDGYREGVLAVCGFGGAPQNAHRSIPSSSPSCRVRRRGTELRPNRLTCRRMRTKSSGARPP